MTNQVTQECYCCFIEMTVEDRYPTEAPYYLPDGMRMVSGDLITCAACRQLGCDVLNPEGCKRPKC